MIGILVALGLAVWFFRSARTLGKNPWAWAAIALASYYIPVLLWGFVLRAVVPTLGVRISSAADAVAFGLALGLSYVVVGAMSAFLVHRHVLLSVASAPSAGTGEAQR